jgi:hypothetical protein
MAVVVMAVVVMAVVVVNRRERGTQWSVVSAGSTRALTKKKPRQTSDRTGDRRQATGDKRQAASGRAAAGMGWASPARSVQLAEKVPTRSRQARVEGKVTRKNRRATVQQVRAEPKEESKVVDAGGCPGCIRCWRPDWPARRIHGPTAERLASALPPTRPQCSVIGNQSHMLMDRDEST